jgi:AcrR family transcriptional regulator
LAATLQFPLSDKRRSIVQESIKVTKKPDRRVQRTEQLLRGALLSLIQEKGFETLSVQDIIDRANVGRATFYAHFDNKEDLLVSGFDNLRASLKERQREALVRRSGLDERMLGFSYEMFAHANEHRDVFLAMSGKRSHAIVQQLLYRILLDLVRDDVKATVSRGHANSVPAEALAQFITGALFGLLMWWLNGKMRLSVEEVNTLFRQLAIPVLKARDAAT